MKVYTVSLNEHQLRAIASALREVPEDVKAHCREMENQDVLCSMDLDILADIMEQVAEGDEVSLIFHGLTV